MRAAAARVRRGARGAGVQAPEGHMQKDSWALANRTAGAPSRVAGLGVSSGPPAGAGAPASTSVTTQRAAESNDIRIIAGRISGDAAGRSSTCPWHLHSWDSGSKIC